MLSRGWPPWLKEKWKCVSGFSRRKDCSMLWSDSESIQLEVRSGLNYQDSWQLWGLLKDSSSDS